jgi:glutaredoxin
MMRNLAVTICALLVFAAGTATAQRMYKWVDSQGNVSYHDRPPPANSGYRVEEKNVRPKRLTSPAANEAAQQAPVVLYSVPKCASCDLARAHLQKRNIPFSERNVESDVKLQDELKAKSGTLAVPTILVGAKVLNGYTEGWLDSELDSAGYPKPEAGAPGETAADDTGFRAPER